jgi:hypothetical protein
MTKITDIVWPQLQAILLRFASRIHATNENLTHTINYTKNDIFPLMAYLSFATQSDEDELVISIDVKYANNYLIITSDICRDNGEVIAIGPLTEILFGNDQTYPDAKIINWLEEFERFLCDNESKIVDFVSELS